MKKTLVLGNEYDEKFREALVELLKSMGAIPLRHDWGVGGSQEVEALEVSLDEKVIVIAAETYIGLSITGDEAQIVEIASKLGVKPA